MRILVTFAVEAEFAPWRKRHDFRKAETSSNEKVYEAKIAGVDVVVGLTGIGPAAANSKICGLTWCEGLDICISSGFAGALRPEYSVGDVLVAKEVVVDDSRRKALGGRIAAPIRLIKLANESGAKTVERFYSSSVTLQTAAEKESLGSLADAVEMESFEVLGEALAWLNEAIAIRAISDTSSEDLPLDFDAVVTGQGELSVARLAGEIVRKPSAIPGLIR